jgi:hypothetical protein
MAGAARREYGRVMTKNSCFATGLITGSFLLTALTGCFTAGSGPSSHSSTPPTGQASLLQEDDYDYYPRYEIYYSRRRNEYVYRDANAWVRRSDLQGITLAMLQSGPMVRMPFHDSPELHHGSIVQSFPRNWEQSGPPRTDQNQPREDQRGENKGDRKDEDQKPDQPAK